MGRAPHGEPRRSSFALAAAPHFKSNQWPDFSEPSYADSVYRAYNVVPYFTTNAVSNADTTVRNSRDRDNQALTPFDQGNSQADVNTTARIRKGIIDGQDMSANARNVKIVTNQVVVTLRGPVDSSLEKRMIGGIANGLHTPPPPVMTFCARRAGAAASLA